MQVRGQWNDILLNVERKNSNRNFICGKNMLKEWGKINTTKKSKPEWINTKWTFTRRVGEEFHSSSESNMVSHKDMTCNKNMKIKVIIKVIFIVFN